MELQLLTDEVWSTITKLAKKAKRGDVAVAYLGTGAHQRLPLRRGSTLVIDAGEGRVKCGITDPSEIRYYIDRGVKVYHRGGLHAKVFVLDGTAVVGSTNVSQHSEYVLDEAAVLSDNRNVVAACRAFVGGLALERITLAEVERLEAMYKPPRGGGGGGGRPGHKRTASKHSPLWVVKTHDLTTLSQEEQDLIDAGQAKAEEEIQDRKRYAVSWIRSTGHGRYPDQVRKGDQIIQLYECDGGLEVWPPCRVVRVGRRHRIRRGAGEASCRVVYLEEPLECDRLSWASFDKAARKAGVTYLRPGSVRAIDNAHHAEELRRILPR